MEDNKRQGSKNDNNKKQPKALVDKKQELLAV